MTKTTSPTPEDGNKGKSSDAVQQGSTVPNQVRPENSTNLYVSPANAEQIKRDRAAGNIDSKDETSLFADAYSPSASDSKSFAGGTIQGTKAEVKPSNISDGIEGAKLPEARNIQSSEKREGGSKQIVDNASTTGAQPVEFPGKALLQPASQKTSVQGSDVATSLQARPQENKANATTSDVGGNRAGSSQLEQPVGQNRGSLTTPVDKAIPGDRVVGGANTVDNAGGRRVETPSSAVGAPLTAPARNGEMPAGTQKGPAVSPEGTIGNVVNTGVKAELHPGAKPVQDGASIPPAGQQKVEGKSDGGATVQSGGVQPKVESGRLDQTKLDTPRIDAQRLDSQNAGQGKFEPVKGGDVFSTQGSTPPANRPDGFRGTDSKVEGVKQADHAGSRDGSTMRDPKSAGVANEVFGQKTESGARGDTQQGGFKPDASAGQKADQITRGIENRVNEGPKQLGTADGATAGTRQPLSESGGKSQGITDGAQPGTKHTNPADGGDKVSSGGSSSGGSSVAESTKRVDVGMQQSGKSDGQSGAGGMGGGSSASADRAPHAPFRVEDAQPSGAKGEGGLRADLGGKGDIASGGKGEAAGGVKGSLGDGPRFDSGETRGGNQPGARFDTGETRGTQQGARFDTGEVKDGRGSIPTGGKSGDGGVGATASDSGIVKGTDVLGIKSSSGGGTGSGGSSGSGAGDGGILGDKRQPSMFPESPVTQSGKPGKPGDGIGSGHLGGDDSVPFILPGAFGGKDGGRRQSDQIFGDKTKGDSTGGKPESGGKADLTGKAELTGKSEPGTAPGKIDSGSMIAKFDALVRGRPDPTAAGVKGEANAVGAKSDSKGDSVSADAKDKGARSDTGISAAMAGPVGSGAAEVGNVLKNFAQSVLSDGKSGQGNDGRGAQGNDGKVVQAADGKTVAAGDSKDTRGAGKAQPGSEIIGNQPPNSRQDFAGPGQKTRILDQTTGSSDTRIIGSGTPSDKSASGISSDRNVSGVAGVPPVVGEKGGDVVVGPRAVGQGIVPLEASKKSELGGAVNSDSNLPGGADGDDVGKISTDDFNLPEVNLLGASDESETVEEIEEVEESEEAKREDEMHYELALGLQLYTSIAEAPYGAYHYFTKEGDTVESVAREVVGDARTAPLVFSLNKDHILASTEYGVHPFKVGVMVQLPTPRDLKNFFGSQT
ncbi:MAG: hypothetical protein DKT66_13250 [Candidatus Melainabacteria bacterium]|nr:MAG: hypothetical protein DKT66_13250 [Candidatus Melainabacteria bacterium]